MMVNYVRETDVEMCQRSNRTFQRILASLSTKVRHRYGHISSPTDEPEEQLQAAIAAKDWGLVSDLAAKLKQPGQSG